MADIYKRLRAHYEAACRHFGEEAVLGVFLYGSQNYNTDTEASDVDTKCVLVPDLRTLACHPYSVKHLDVDGEVCECMSIQHMVENWKKQNINFVETMFTPHCIISNRYNKIWRDFIDAYKEEIARYDIKRAILSMANQALHTIKQDPTDYKKQMNLLRIRYSLYGVIEDTKTDYWKSISMDSQRAAYLREVRKTGVGEGMIQMVCQDFENMVHDVDEIVSKCAKKADKEKINSLFEDFIISLITQRL